MKILKEYNSQNDNCNWINLEKVPFKGKIYTTTIKKNDDKELELQHYTRKMIIQIWFKLFKYIAIISYYWGIYEK